MRRPRITPAASVAAQAKVRATEDTRNVTKLRPEAIQEIGGASTNSLYSHIDNTPDPKTGSPRLRVIIPSKRAPEVYELTRLMVQPDLAKFLAEGFRYWASQFGTRSRINKCRVLNFQFGSFVSTLEEPILPEAIDEVFWAALVAWLNGPRQVNGQPWAPSRRAEVLGAVKTSISALLDHPEYGRIATYLLDNSGFPHNPWPGLSTKNVPTAVLSPSERRAMIVASLNEVAAISQRLDERESALEMGRILLEESRREGHRPPFSTSVGACAAQIAEAFPDRLASVGDLYAVDRLLGKAVQHEHGMTSIRRILYSTFRDLVPFVLLIGVKTAFNADTIRSLTWNRVRISSDGRTVTFLGVKNRASGLQVNISEDSISEDESFPAEIGLEFGLARVLDILRRLTERTRSILSDPDAADCLFIGVPIWGGSNARAIEDRNRASGGSVWSHSLSAFVEDHALTSFTLASLRPSEGEVEWRRTGDLLAVRDRLGHKTISTTRNHYTSDGMRRDSKERVAETQTLYHRWAQTGGRVDPRHLSERFKSAATPGFGCLDPYDSPRAGQRKGTLCSAYGECADCPLAQAWPKDVQAAAYYLALPKAIQDARLGRVSPKHWASKWPPILIAHNRLIDEIPEHIRADTLRFSVKLKPVG